MECTSDKAKENIFKCSQKKNKQTNKQNTLVKRLEISLRKQTWKRGKNLSKKKKKKTNKTR